MNPNQLPPAEIAPKLGIGIHDRHIFLCTGLACCTAEEGTMAWETLKKELTERGLTPGTAGHSCARTKAGCLRVCNEGPIALVYPEGTYYSHMTADKIPTLVERHLEGGTPIDEWIFARNPLDSQK